MLEIFYLEEMPKSDEGPFLKNERELLNAISVSLGRAIERMRNKDKLLMLARTDPLTGLFNRRYFIELAEKELERIRRYNHDLACIMFDIDYFKEINDRYGHVLGDQVLLGIVKDYQVIVREVDILARYGGDEFVILLAETNTTVQRPILLQNVCASVLRMPPSKQISNHFISQLVWE